MTDRKKILDLLSGKKIGSQPAFSGLIHVTAEGLQSEGLLFHDVHTEPRKMAKASASTFKLSGMPSAVALGSLAYQTVVAGTTFSLWFALIVKFSASRLSAFTFLTPLFGVAAGHFMLGEPLTPAFALAVALVAVRKDLDIERGVGAVGHRPEQRVRVVGIDVVVDRDDVLARGAVPRNGAVERAPDLSPGHVPVHDDHHNLPEVGQWLVH